MRGRIASTIAQVYFDNDTLLTLPQLPTLHERRLHTGELQFHPALGGSGSPTVISYADSAKADPPPAQNGIDPGELLAIFFTLVGGGFGDVINAMVGGSSARWDARHFDRQWKERQLSSHDFASRCTAVVCHGPHHIGPSSPLAEKAKMYAVFVSVSLITNIRPSLTATAFPWQVFCGEGCPQR